MNIKEHKMEFSLIYILTCSIIGVIVWYVLDRVNYTNSIEISILISISLIIGFITYAAHEKGLLLDPISKSIDCFSNRYKEFTYYRKKVNLNDFKRKLVRKTNEVNIDDNRIMAKYLPFKYNRKKFRH
ncbi:MAG: hypothetical protein JXA54_03635 [Candidatus Heimdallarchaeota archaeon]|nr:hypothetical protein [Candidatus Heimdallarchaeota archaeon]